MYTLVYTYLLYNIFYITHLLLAYECDDDGHERGNDRVNHC